MDLTFHTGSHPVSDTAILAQLHRESFLAEGYAAPWSENSFASLIQQPGLLWCEAFIAKKLVGFGLIRIICDEAELLTLCRNPNFVRNSIGFNILVTLEGEVKHCGVLCIVLEVAENAAIARSVYDKSGYTQVGFRQGYYTNAKNQPENALILRKNIQTH